MTIEDYRRRLGWSQRELARRARLDYNTVRKAESGDPVSGRTAFSIAEAFAQALGERVLVEDIEDLKVSF
ncbi:MAG: helix-turn-helix transcriptional regulator [Abitibacteriaceae bacterium]|nr:helix-turn-helix transcriptional regulator [Abditibacteriaceae bacterium]